MMTGLMCRIFVRTLGSDSAPSFPYKQISILTGSVATTTSRKPNIEVEKPSGVLYLNTFIPLSGSDLGIAVEDDHMSSNKHSSTSSNQSST